MSMRRRWFLSLVLLGLAVWVFWPSGHPDVADSEGPTPSASRKARAALRAIAKPAARPQSEAEAEDDAEEDENRRWENLVVALRSSRNGFLFFNGEGRMDPGLFWPLADESPFPDSETAAALQDLIDQPDAVAERDWIALADAEGFSGAQVDVEADPWSAVLALEVERRAVVREYEDAYVAAWEGQPAQPWTRPHPPLPAQRVLGMPHVDPVLDLADDVIARNPDHPAADFARLYLLDALAMSTADDAWAEAIDVLRETADPLVMTQTAQLMAALPGKNVVEVGDLDRLADVYEDAWDLTECLHLSAFGLEQAMMKGDDDRARAWLERFERSTRDACAGSESPNCQMYRDNLDSAVAFLGERDVADAATWQQAFEIACWNCARDQPQNSLFLPAGRIQASVRGHASWTGRWDWEPWECEGVTCSDRFTACVEAQVVHGPVPFEDVDVRLTVVGEVSEIHVADERPRDGAGGPG